MFITLIISGVNSTTILRNKLRKISLYDISIFVSYYRILLDVYILIFLFIIMICRSIFTTLRGEFEKILESDLVAQK